MTTGQKVGSVGVSLALVLATAWLSQLPTPHTGADRALIRMSWRLAGVAIEECRTLSPEELAQIPAHMRRAQECTRDIVDYELRVEVGGRTEVVDTLSPSGARRDRPIYVLRDVAVAPGSHDVAVDFSALLPVASEPPEGPVTLRYEDTVVLGSNEIALITLTESGERLVRRAPGAGG